jgi:hypothetical protein
MQRNYETLKFVKWEGTLGKFGFKIVSLVTLDVRHLTAGEAMDEENTKK